VTESLLDAAGVFGFAAANAFLSLGFFFDFVALPFTPAEPFFAPAERLFFGAEPTFFGAGEPPFLAVARPFLFFKATEPFFFLFFETAELSCLAGTLLSDSDIVSASVVLS
jgi:hypothetical protein